MHIAIDIDDSAGDLLSGLILFHNERYGTTLTKEDFHSCWYREVWGGTKEEEVEKLIEFFKTDYFKNVLPMPGAQEAMKFLKKEGHKLSVVTGRIYSLTQQTEEWIDKYFKNIFSGIYHTNSYGLTGVKIKKSEMCKKQNMNLIVDDDLIHIIDCTNAGIPVFVFNSPWNQVDLPNGAIRMNNWSEIPSLMSKF
ncbi:MAG: HAD family hydrolase [Candidatus Nomurabacteria bacterium]|nr:HAD family hydrolase [Candidatus Nomurabacteria bacterium]